MVLCLWHIFYKIIYFHPLNTNQTIPYLFFLKHLYKKNILIDYIVAFNFFEFKFDVKKDNSKEALQQIIEKKYSEKFEIDKKKIIAIGVSFSSEERNINGYKIKLIKN